MDERPLSERVKAGFLRGLENQTKREKTAFSPTDSSKCITQLALELKNAIPTETRDFYSNWRLELGKAVGQSTAYVLERSDFQVTLTEQRIDVPILGLTRRLHGYVDILLGELPIIVEVKSWYGFMQRKDLEEGKYKPDYALQLMWYEFALSKNEGVLLYVPLEPGESLYSFDIKRSDARLDGVVKRWQIVEENLARGTLPDPEFRYKYDLNPIELQRVPAKKLKQMLTGNAVHGDWQCRYCPFKIYCVTELQKDTLGYTPEELARIQGGITP